MQINSFEEITAWRKSRELTRKIYEITGKEKFRKDWGLSDQIRRAAVSAMSNIAEGFDSGFNAEFIRFLMFSRRSASEIQNHLYISLDQGYLTDTEFQGLYSDAEDVRKVTNGFIRYLRSKRTNALTRQRANAQTRKHANTQTRKHANTQTRQRAQQLIS